MFSSFKGEEAVKKTAHTKESHLALGLPTEFDWRTQWPDCVRPIRDQWMCGSCWAFSSTNFLADRFCIATDGAINMDFSPQDMVECDH